MRYLTTTGIILRKKSFGEQDQFVTFYSPDCGKVEAIAKGSRKISSSFTGHLELLNICAIQIYKKNDRAIMTQCQLRQSFKKVRANLNLTMFSFLLLEIFCKIAQADEHSQEMFDLLVDTLTKIDADTKNELHIESFKLKILKLAGALPEISRCSNCHKRWEANAIIQTDNEGHIFCHDCAPDRTTLIPFNIMKLIHYVAHTESNKVEPIQLTDEEKETFKKINDIFLQNYISSELKSEAIVTSLRA